MGFSGRAVTLLTCDTLTSETNTRAGDCKFMLDSEGLKSAQCEIAPSMPSPNSYLPLILATAACDAAAEDPGVATVEPLGLRRCLIASGIAAKKWPLFQRAWRRLAISSLEIGSSCVPLLSRSDVQYFSKKL